MGTVIKPNEFSQNTTARSSEVNENFDTIYNEFNGNIGAANLGSDSVTTAKIADGNVTSAKLASSSVTAAKTNFGGNYSTSETNTGFTWTDGTSAIYKKTINLGTLPNNTTKNVAHSITNLSLVVGFEGVAESSGTNLILPYAATSANFSITVSVTTTNVVIITGTDRSSFTGYVTVYYTKTS